MKKDAGSLKASAIVVMICLLVVSFLALITPEYEAMAGTQGTDGWVYFDAWGNKYYHDTYTWGDSTQVTAEIKIPFNFGKPDVLFSWAWDTQHARGDDAYADNEMFWIDRSTWTQYANIAVDSRSVISIAREEHVVTDGAEDGVIVDFILMQFNH